MAVVMDQQTSFKHFCRICKKGFGCGRALGGHMRAHGIGDEAGSMDDDYSGSDWEEKLHGGETSPGASNKRMYALRTNPNRLKSCRSCENCGKEFSSWKSFLEHGKCSSDDAEFLVSSPEGEDGNEGRSCGGWSKGKRSRRVLQVLTESLTGPSDRNRSFHMGPMLNCPSSEEEDLANCLVMLSAARVEPPAVETEESCGSASKDEDRHRPSFRVATDYSRTVGEKSKAPQLGVFECKACKKVFGSHQALGGHRASHKKVKGCFAKLDDSLADQEYGATTLDDFSIQSKTSVIPFQYQSMVAALPLQERRPKVHECTICHRIFASGQALGGHKRCHWVSSDAPDTSVSRVHPFSEQTQQLQERPHFNKPEPLDLNKPAPADGRQDDERLLQLKIPTGLYLHHWKSNNGNNSLSDSMIQVDDEADSKIKLAKLSDLKDLKMGGSSSQWLQVGIGSTANGSDIDP